MIHEVDEALLALLRRDAIPDDAVQLALDAPTKEWSGHRNAPTLNVFLYDIREDVRRREHGLINEYDDNHRIVARHLPPRYFVLSYLVTAWTTRPEDEHRLLAAALSCLLRQDAIGVELLSGSLRELGVPVPLTVALPPPEDRSFADVWSALGGELHPSLDVRVVTPIEPARHYPAAPLVRERLVDMRVGQVEP